MKFLTDEYTVREFDNESILDPALKPVLVHAHATSSNAITDPCASASPPLPTDPDSGEGGENMTEPTEKRVEVLEKELAELKIERDEMEHKFRSERGLRTAAEIKLESLQRDLQELQSRFAQL